MIVQKKLRQAQEKKAFEKFSKLISDYGPDSYSCIALPNNRMQGPFPQNDANDTNMSCCKI